ncbi:MAG: 16S rRNA (cytidine(1402)-2'-O)-methyltransferase [Methylobacter sp.]|nr:MAG: 16S rRNA (cytidine(1402)-2'-O)-methyltransferase [Methylobacter sp.]
MSRAKGRLYVVATPIGNLADISLRALEVLKQVDLIAAEDTRHVKVLLNHYGIAVKTVSLHQHNEDKVADTLLEKLADGQNIALVSDAGTPLLSDPGMPLVKQAKAAGFEVSPIPGPCALIAALSAAGLPVTRFCFEGFPPRTSGPRKAFFQNQLSNPVTWVFYESSHRILACLKDMADVLEPERIIVIAREITKLHETIVKATLAEALALVEQSPDMRKGEFVVIVDGAQEKPEAEDITPEQEKILVLLLKQCSLKTAAELAAQITGGRKKLLYQAALRLAKAAVEVE